MTSGSGLETLLARLRAADLPEAVRLAAARGALPLPPADLLRAQAWLARHDAAEPVRAAAAEALARRRAEEVAALVDGEGFSIDAAEFYAARPEAPPAILEALARNPECPDEIVARFAARASAELIEVLILNQVRLGRAPSIVGALEANPRLSPGQRSQLREIRKHLHGAGAAPAAAPEVELDAETAAEMEESIRAAEVEELRMRESARAPAAPQEGEEGAAREEAAGRSIYARILEMGAGEKVKLAFTGNAEERAILIRDGNRVVSAAVLKSPRLTDKDIESYVNMRTLREDVLRTIGSNREWLRNYSVVLGLIRNPKTPPGIALPLLSRLNNRDLNVTSGDRNVSEVVRRQARKNFVGRTQGGGRG
jgi:hypothetical protein